MGGLLPHFGGGKAAPGGRRELYAAIDDELFDDPVEKKLIPREDVAEVCVQCLLKPQLSKGRSFDLGAGPEGEAGVPVELDKVLAPLAGKNCNYMPADKEFNDPAKKS